jgi:psiF repeat
MRLFKIIPAAAVLALFGANICFAQAPAAPTTPDTDKKAISKACSALANTKGLHGHDRKVFRSQCKKNGGKEPT